MIIRILFALLLFITNAHALSLANDTAIAGCDAIVDLVDGGVGAGSIQIYSGTVPTDADTALSGNTLLAEPVFSATAFGACADNTGKATATAASITSDSSANASGTASFFRVTNGDGTVIWQGTAGTSGTDLILDSATITAGQTVSVSSLTISLPE